MSASDCDKSDQNYMKVSSAIRDELATQRSSVVRAALITDHRRYQLSSFED